jgi:hypothetical protein
MLSARTLDRVSGSYRRGYNDGYAGREPVGEVTDGPLDRPFANHDYAEGHKAGKNDRYWDDKLIADNRAERENARG